MPRKSTAAGPTKPTLSQAGLFITFEARNLYLACHPGRQLRYQLYPPH